MVRIGEGRLAVGRNGEKRWMGLIGGVSFMVRVPLMLQVKETGHLGCAIELDPGMSRGLLLFLFGPYRDLEH